MLDPGPDPEKLASATTVVDTRGRTSMYNYNSTTHNQTFTGPDGRTTVETLNPANNYVDTAIVDPNGHTTSYGYNSSNQLDQITDPNGNITLFGYDVNGRVDSVTQVTNFTSDTGPTTTFVRGHPEVRGFWSGHQSRISLTADSFLDLFGCQSGLPDGHALLMQDVQYRGLGDPIAGHQLWCGGSLAVGGSVTTTV